MQLSAAFSRIRDVLQDDGTRWPDAELVRWWNDGQRDTVTIKPDANVVTAAVQVSAGVTRQNLPADALRLVDIYRNMGSAGTTPGKPVRQVMREFMDTTVPTWHMDTGTGVTHFTYDLKNPRVYHVYPAQVSSTYVEMVYSAMPADVTSSTSNSSLDSMYDTALIEYVLARAYSKESEVAANAAAAQAHYAMYQQMIGVRTAGDVSAAPTPGVKV